MKKRTLLLWLGLATVFLVAQVGPQLYTTAYTRALLRAADAGTARSILQVTPCGDAVLSQFNLDQFTVIDGTNVHLKSGSITTNLIARGTLAVAAGTALDLVVTNSLEVEGPVLADTLGTTLNPNIDDELADKAPINIFEANSVGALGSARYELPLRSECV